MDTTLLQQLGALVEMLNQVKGLCDSMSAAAQDLQVKYSSAVVAQTAAGESLASMMALAAQITAKIGG